MFLFSLVQFYVGGQKERKSYVIFLYTPQTLPQDLGLLQPKAASKQLPERL